MNPSEIFISYAWGGESENLVNKLYQVLVEKNYNVIRDKIDLGYKGNIKEFMQRIGAGDAIIVVISDKYLRSPNCMYEIVQIQQNGELAKRIFPIVLKDADIYSPVKRLNYIKHWENEVKALNEAMKGVDNMAVINEIQQELSEFNLILNSISGISTFLKNTNTLSPEILEQENFAPLLNELNKLVATTETKNTAIDKDKLKKLIAENRIVSVFEILNSIPLEAEQKNLCIMLEAQFNELERNKMMGILSHAQMMQQTAQLNYQLINCISQL
jgi:hypothetical protein